MLTGDMQRACQVFKVAASFRPSSSVALRSTILPKTYSVCLSSIACRCAAKACRSVGASHVELSLCCSGSVVSNLLHDRGSQSAESDCLCFRPDSIFSAFSLLTAKNSLSCCGVSAVDVEFVFCCGSRDFCLQRRLSRGSEDNLSRGSDETLSRGSADNLSCDRLRLMLGSR